MWGGGRSPPARRKHVKAWRKYVQFLFSIGRLDRGMQQYLAFLRSGSIKRETQRAVQLDTIVGYREVMGERVRRPLPATLGGARLKAHTKDS